MSRLDDLLAEFSDRWARGESPRAEDYLSRLSESESSEDEALELVYHEFCLAEQSGLSPDPTSFLERFPTLRARLGSMLKLHGVIDPSRFRLGGDSRLADLPEPGDEVGPYLLLRELGRGGFARVYLARQTDLSDRLVVVKISRRAGVESQLLARARHPYIVEVLRHAEADGGSMHLICMPFLGGSTLLDVLKVARARGHLPGSGRAFLEDLDEVAAPEFSRYAAEGPVHETIARLSYPRAAAWIIARLAEALDHAHRQGVTHGDLKPSNVLIAADGRPMLLDFNLAFDWHAEDEGRTGRGGGTLAYMSPERLEVLATRGSGGPAPTPVARHRADLYALGYVLLEMLSGDPPSVPDDPGVGKGAVAAWLADARSRMDLGVVLGRSCVPAGLRPILRRCLAADPADRYTRGRELAADLDCWRQDRPLLIADEPSWPIRLGRWSRARRRPLIAAALMVLVGGIVEYATSRHLNGSLTDRARSKLELLWSGAEPGVYRFLTKSHWRPEDSLDTQTARRQRGLYGLLEPEGPDWRDRPDVAPLPLADREDLELWLLDRTWAEASARLERSDDEEDLELALADLEKVPEWASLEPVVKLRARIREDLELPEPPILVANYAPPTWLDAFARGLAEEPRNALAALDEYQRVLSDRPESYWGNYRAASVCFRLGRYAQASNHLDLCLRRRPQTAALHAQKAGCLFLLGNHPEALRESNLAIKLNPDEPYGYQNRARVRARIGQVAGLEADLRRFASLIGTQRKAARWEPRLQTLLMRNLSIPIDGLNMMEDAISPEDSEMRNSLAALLDLAGRPEDALKQYDQLLRNDPDHLIARFRRANLRYKVGDPRYVDDFRTVVQHPRIAELVREQPEALEHCTWS